MSTACARSSSSRRNISSACRQPRASCCGSGPFSTSYTQNAITPILYNQTVIVSGLDKGVTALRIVKKNGGWDAESVWENSDVAMYMTNGVVVRDTLVSLSHKNSGQFFGLDARTGKTLWKSPPRQATNAEIARAGDLLFVLKDDASSSSRGSGRTASSRCGPTRWPTARPGRSPRSRASRIFVKDVASLALWTLN
jgi:hypothetical protein